MTKKGLLRFGSYVFRVNPRIIEVHNRRNFYQLQYLTGESLTTDLGPCCERITGKGVFGGELAETDYYMLKRAMLSGEQLLSIPGGPNVSAVMTSLESTVEAGPDTIGYSFEFVRTGTGLESLSGTLEDHIVLSGETAFMIAGKYQIPFENLMIKNPWITDPFNLAAGMAVSI